jgi:predicted enzyme related to lactoylglutathione lyase
MFSIAGKFSIGLMPEENIHKILGDHVPHPSQGNGIPRCELYLFVESPDSRLMDVADAGGSVISEMSERSWGDSVAYGMDPDGHIIALAKSMEPK